MPWMKFLGEGIIDRVGQENGRSFQGRERGLEKGKSKGTQWLSRREGGLNGEPTEKNARRNRHVGRDLPCEGRSRGEKGEGERN